MEYDVIVVGAGPSGCMAAIAAARCGAKVLLIDKNGYPGGANTASMVCPMMAFHSGDRQIIKGIAQEVIDRMISHGACLGHIPDPLGVTSSITPIEPAILRMVYFEMLEEEKNITLLLHSFLCGAETKENRITGIKIANKSGVSFLRAKRFVDATGDGDLAAMCHVGFDLGRPADNLSQPMTMMFKLGGVELDKVIDYVEKNPEQFVLSVEANLHQYLAVSGFFDVVKTAQEKGDFHIPRDRILFFQGIYPGELFVNTTRILKRNGISAEDLTMAEQEGYRQTLELLHFFQKYLPGFEKCYLVAVADEVGVRESRRFHCKYTLTINDVYGERVFPDSIAVCAFPIDIHDPKGCDLQWIRSKKVFCYDIPYGTMLPNKVDNLLITGRCISAEHEALASARISPTAMALGQAAGVAAALSIQQGTTPAETEIALIQEKLREQGAVVSRADEGKKADKAAECEEEE